MSDPYEEGFEEGQHACRVAKDQAERRVKKLETERDQLQADNAELLEAGKVLARPQSRHWTEIDAARLVVARHQPISKHTNPKESPNV